jgi:hypothetical protein
VHTRPLLAALLGTLAAPARDEQVVERSFAFEFELATTRFHLAAREPGKSDEQDAPAVRRTESELLELRDTSDDATDPLARFEREYETVSSSYSFAGGGQEPSEELVTAGLEGKTVTFEREDEGEWSRSCDAEGVNPRQIERLRAELGLEVFLPAEEIEVGASWELGFVPFERLIGPLGPVGARARRRAMGGGGGALAVSPACLVEPLWLLLAKAEGRAKFTRLEPDEGEEWEGVAQFEFHFESTYDGSKHLLRGREAQVKDEVEGTWSGTGRVAWTSGDAGTVELALEGELHFVEEFAVEFEGNGIDAELDGEIECGGRFEAEAKASRVE